MKTKILIAMSVALVIAVIDLFTWGPIKYAENYATFDYFIFICFLLIKWIGVGGILWLIYNLINNNESKLIFLAPSTFGLLLFSIVFAVFANEVSQKSYRLCNLTKAEKRFIERFEQNAAFAFVALEKYILKSQGIKHQGAEYDELSYTVYKYVFEYMKSSSHIRNFESFYLREYIGTRPSYIKKTFMLTPTMKAIIKEKITR